MKVAKAIHCTIELQGSIDEVYEKVKSISIDYAISEKADNLLLIPGDFGWDDIGEWKVIYDLSEKDANGNAIVGNKSIDQPLLLESKNNLLHLDKKLVAMIGVENMIVVDTGEILMICPMSRSQDVKKLVEELKKTERKEYL